jgi:hypothetical protein
MLPRKWFLVRSAADPDAEMAPVVHKFPAGLVGLREWQNLDHLWRDEPVHARTGAADMVGSENPRIQALRHAERGDLQGFRGASARALDTWCCRRSACRLIVMAGEGPAGARPWLSAGLCRAQGLPSAS